MAPLDRALPGWLRSRSVPAAGLVLALLLTGAAIGFVAYQRQGFERAALDRAELYARVLEDHANRTFDSSTLTLQALAQAIESQSGTLDAARVSAQLSDALLGQPYLRSLSLLDARGRVLASSNPDNVGALLPAFAQQPDGRPPARGLAPALRGRDLGAIDSAAPADAGLLPLVRPLARGRGVLVAAINIAYFGNQYSLILGDASFVAAMLGYDGRLITATEGVRAEPGSLQRTHPIFSRFLPAIESAHFSGPGLGGEPAFGAFRATRRQPLVLLAETAQAQVDEQVAGLARRTAGAAGAILIVIGAFSLLAWRSLRGHEAARDDLARAQEAAAAQHAFTDRLFEVSPVPTVVRGIDGRYQRVNRAWTELTGLTPPQVIGRTLDEVLPAERAARYALHEREAIATGRMVVYEGPVPDHHGNPRDVVIRVTPFTDAEGDVGGVIACLLDVTEFRRAERRTREAQRAAERANDAKSGFIANVSHELRTPLQSILGFSELGVRRAKPQPLLHEMFIDIQHAGQRMLKLVNDLLDLTHLDSTVGAVRLQTIDLAPVLREVVHELEPLANERRLDFATPGAARPLIAEADGFRLQQVLRNVIANALRFAPSGTTITLDWCREADGGALISVRDEGPGIPLDELESIFAPFVQSSRTRDGSGGTGLGLAVCRKIMAAHRGSIRARNADGGGAVFEVRLPPSNADASFED